MGDQGAFITDPYQDEREFFIDNLLVRIHVIIVMIWWTGLAPEEFEFPFPGSLTSTFLTRAGTCHVCREEETRCGALDHDVPGR